MRGAQLVPGADPAAVLDAIYTVAHNVRELHDRVETHRDGCWRHHVGCFAALIAEKAGAALIA